MECEARLIVKSYPNPTPKYRIGQAVYFPHNEKDKGSKCGFCDGSGIVTGYNGETGRCPKCTDGLTYKYLYAPRRCFVGEAEIRHFQDEAVVRVSYDLRPTMHSNDYYYVVEKDVFADEESCRARCNELNN